MAWTPRSESDALSVGFVAPVTPPQSGDQGIISFDQQSLFQTPPELLCPITLTIFRDPVINTAGHTYERNAMESYFASSDGDVDPLSRTPLPTRTLTPVHVLRSRALEYRQRTANTCIEVRAHYGHSGTPHLALHSKPVPTGATTRHATYDARVSWRVTTCVSKASLRSWWPTLQATRATPTMPTCCTRLPRASCRAATETR